MTKTQLSFLLLTLFVVLYLLPLGARPLFIQDETRYAEVPREILATGDWVVPHSNGLRYFEKPIMGYWLSAAAMMAFGENNFAVRLPSALSSGLMALMILLLCGSVTKWRTTLPWLASLVFLTSFAVASIGTFAVLDNALNLFLTGTLICFFLATEQEPGSRHDRFLLLASGLLVGCAFLVKGFLAFALPVLTVTPYLISRGRWRDLFRMVWLPVAGAALVSLPWSLLIHVREPDFWHYFFWNEHVRRFIADSAQHKQPFWYFLAVLPAMFLPWIFVAPAAIQGLMAGDRHHEDERRLFRFCLCWFFFPFLFFSASSGKLITYILPCFPPLAILTAMGLRRVFDRPSIRGLQRGMLMTALVAGLGALGLAAVQLLGPEHLRAFSRSWKWLLLINGLVIMILVILSALRCGEKTRKLFLFGLAPVALLLIAHFTIPSLALKMKAPAALLNRHVTDIHPDTFILSGEEIARAVCWYFKRDDVYLVERAGELQYGLDYAEARHRLLSPLEAGEFIRKHPGRVALIAGHKEYARWQPFLPQLVSVDSSGNRGYIFVRY